MLPTFSQHVSHRLSHIQGVSAGGYVATKYSSKVVLGAGVVLWSLFTVFTPTAAEMGLMLVPLLVSRGIMGAGEGVAFPAISNLFAK